MNLSSRDQQDSSGEHSNGQNFSETQFAVTPFDAFTRQKGRSKKEPHMTDRYTKVTLTVIALSLVGLSVRDFVFPTPVLAMQEPNAHIRKGRGIHA